MAERVRRDSDVPIAQFDVPYRGTMQSQGVHRVPKDAIYDGRNLLVRDGKLRSRAGTVLLNGTVFERPILGAGLAVTPGANLAIAISRFGLYELAANSTSWNRTNTLTFANDNNNVVIDIAYIETANKYVALIASDGFVLKAWDSLTHTVADITPTLGVVPRAKSVCVVGRRVVTLTAPHTINWSEVADFNSWSSLSYNKLASTNDTGIAVRALSNYGLAVYKERSIHLGRITGQPFGSAFSFSEPILVEGPAGTGAIATTPIGDVYMTKNGRVGWFRGGQEVNWIADGIWTYLQNDIHPSYSYLIRAICDYRLHTVNFYYPRVTGVGDNRGMVTVNLPYEGLDVEGLSGNRPYCFLGESAYPITAVCELRFNSSINRSLLFTTVGVEPLSYYQDENSVVDANVEFTSYFQTGLVGMPGGKHTGVIFESLLERGVGYGDVTVESVLSYQLETQSGDIPQLSAQNISLEFNPVNEYLGGTSNTRTRFFGLKYTWSSHNRVRWAGTICYGRGV